MLKILLVGHGSESGNELERGISTSGFQLVSKLGISINLLDALDANDVDAIVVNVDTPQKSMLEQIKIINEFKPTPIVIFSQNSNNQLIQAAVEAGVSAYIVDGLSSSRVKSIIDTALARFRSNLALRNELKKAKSSLADRILIDKAKGIIMEQQNCNENEAYIKLRKMAMDSNKKIGQMANDVINVFSCLN